MIFTINAINSFRSSFLSRSQFYDNLILKNLINTDKLTGAFSRSKFDEEIRKQIAKAQHSSRKFSIAIFDIDNFKRINDKYGHLEGDSILSGIVEIVNANKRPRDMLSRWGGEEFIVIFPGSGLGQALELSERLRAKIADCVFNTGEIVTCSFGVTEFQNGDTPSSLLRRADKYVYDAKSNGKNRVVFGPK